MAEERKPWHKQSGESARAYHAFCHYRDLLAHERSLNKAYTAHQKACKSKNPLKMLGASPEWQKWTTQFSWRDRADKHDAEIAERTRQQRLVEIDKMNQRHMSIAMALQNLVVERLNQLALPSESGKVSVFEMNPMQMAGLLDRAAVIERRARGEATSISKVETSQGPAHMAVDFSKLSDDELDAFQALLEKAKAEQ